MFLSAPGKRLLNFWDRFLDERLPSETGIDGHYEKQIDLGEVRFDGGNVCGRVDCEADLFAERTNLPDERIDLIAEFDVDGDIVRAGFGEGFEENFRTRTHE